MVKRIPRTSLSDSVNRPASRSRHQRIERLKVLSKHPFAVPVITTFALMFITGVILAVVNFVGPQPTNPNVVVISHDGVSETVSSKEPTVGALLDKLELKLNEGDVVEPHATTKIQQDDFRINIYRAVPVAIFDGSNRTYTFSAATTPRSVARQAGVSLFPEDGITTQPVRDFVANGNIGQEIHIDRSVPVNMTLYGVAVSTRSRADTVRELLAEKNVKLEPQDIVWPAVDAPLAAGVQVNVVRNGIATRSVVEDIPMPTQNIADNTLSYGVTAVRQQGSPGKRTVIYEINTQNGAEVSRRAIQITVIQEPVTQIKVVGSNLSGIKGDMALAGIAPGDYTYADYIITHESRWNPAAVNAAGCAGLGQACPGSKLAAVCPNWQNDPVCQLKFFHKYAIGRYGSWQAAYNFKVAKGWW